MSDEHKSMMLTRFEYHYLREYNISTLTYQKYEAAVSSAAGKFREGV